ncbi:hypothetical protein IWW50_003497 [Coemansia erecta]|nr:hypothetical protein GGF43_002816 [Coemansia sp. RSA 2618]KAJ2824094.1 hypothetical protein IWW50_003497 [Coemansia erecta]
MQLAHFSLASVLAVALLGTANAGLSGCPKNLAFQLTNVLQAGQIQFPYASCEEASSGEYVAGIARFSTEDGSAWKVISAYRKINNNDDVFSKYDGVLGKNSGSSSSGGGSSSSSSSLSGFCDAWESVGTDQKFWSAQGSVFESDYFKPSQDMADSLGLKLSITQAQLYDAAIAHGTGTGSGNLNSLIQATNKGITKDISGSSSNTLRISGYDIDEIEWLKRFLTTRAKYKDVHGTKESIDSYTYMINNGGTVWGDKIEVLNNKGEEGDVNCDNSYDPYPTPDHNLGASTTSSSSSSSSSSTHHSSKTKFDPYGDGDGHNGDDDDDDDDDDNDNRTDDDNNDDGDGETTGLNCQGYGQNYHCGAGNSNLAYGSGMVAGLAALFAI